MSRRLGLAAATMLAACGGLDAPPDEAVRFIEERTFRRSTLESQLVSRSNAYAFERLRDYAVDGGWDDLALEPLAPEAEWPDASAPTTRSAFLALGRRAFFEYPARVGAEFAPGLSDPERLPHARPAGDGSGRAVVTCATCHTGPDGAVGAPNTALDVGALYAEAADAPPESPLRSWGPGRMDVTADTADDPVRFADLRPVAHQRLLQSAGAVRQRSPVDLAVRLETLLITASGRLARPPRATVAALAWWLHSASVPLPRGLQPPAVFVGRCARCHDPGAAYASGEPIPSEEVGADPAAAWSPGRGTGGYRAPTLIGVADRAPLLHDASIPDLATLLDPGRVEGGHTFTADAPASDVADLRAFLEGL